MFINIFKKDYITQLFFILIVSVLLWLRAFMNPEMLVVNIEPYSLFYDYIAFFASNNPVATVILAFALILFEGAYFNYVLASNKLAPNMTLMPMFLYIVLMSLMFENQTFTPLLFTNIFLLLALNNMLQCYDQHVSYEKIFNASFCLALMFVFYYPSVYLLLLMVCVLLIYKLYYFREWIVMILGFIAPFFAIFTYFFLVDQVDTVISELTTKVMTISFNVLTWSTPTIIVNILLLLLFLISFISTLQQVSDKITIIRKKTTIVLLLTLIGVLFSLYEVIFPINMQNYVIPMTFVLTLYFMKTRRKTRMTNFVFFVFLVTAFANVYLVN